MSDSRMLPGNVHLLRRELRDTLNSQGIDSLLNIPDGVLADFVIAQLEVLYVQRKETDKLTGHE